MSKRTLIILLILILALAIVLLVYFLIIRPPKTKNEVHNVIKNGFLENERYLIKIPDGWEEENNVGAYSMIINNREQIDDLNAQKINFRSYYSVVYDELKENTPADYYKKIVESLKKQFPEIKIIKEDDKDLSEGKTHFVEAEIRQQDIDFSVLLSVFIKDKNVWIISFNTLKSNWDEYKDLFYEIAGSLKIK